MGRDVVVAGAGIAGLAVATGLACDGWEVTVRERWEQIPLVGTGIGLWPAAQQGLATLSPALGDLVQREAVEFGDTAVFRPDGRRITRVPRDAVERRSGVPVRILPRAELLRALLTAAQAAGARGAGARLRRRHAHAPGPHQLVRGAAGTAGRAADARGPAGDDGGLARPDPGGPAHHDARVVAAPPDPRPAPGAAVVRVRSAGAGG